MAEHLDRIEHLSKINSLLIEGDRKTKEVYKTAERNVPETG